MDYKKEYLRMKKKYIDLKKYAANQMGGNSIGPSYLQYGPLDSIIESDMELKNDLQNFNIINHKNNYKKNDSIKDKIQNLKKILSNANLDTETEFSF